jgi:hypothetical protein
MYGLAIFAVLPSGVASFYYIRLIKSMYFDKLRIWNVTQLNPLNKIWDKEIHISRGMSRKAARMVLLSLSWDAWWWRTNKPGSVQPDPKEQVQRRTLSYRLTTIRSPVVTVGHKVVVWTAPSEFRISQIQCNDVSFWVCLFKATSPPRGVTERDELSLLDCSLRCWK